MSAVKILVDACRLVVGSLFIVSGLIKANDALGFMYKLEEYFEPGALNFPGLTEWALPIAVFICLGEILLGVALVLGAMPKITAGLTGFMMAFFTWLTWYTANCDPLATKMITDATGAPLEIANQCVLACGCFGNAIPLTPYESFIKDVVLSILTVPIVWGAFANQISLNSSKQGMVLITASLVMIYLFGELMLDWNFPVLFAAVAYAVGEGIKKRWSKGHVEWAMAAGIAICCGLFQYQTLTHLPMKDYRPYAEGESVIENRKSAEDLGVDGPVYATQYTFRNTKTGQDTMILSNEWIKIYNEPWFKSSYETVSFDGPEVKVSDGYEPRILDFQILDGSGMDWADEFLEYENVLLYVSKDLTESRKESQAAMNELALQAGAAGWLNAGLTNATAEENSAFKKEFNVPYTIYSCDQTELKIIIRSNPGLVWLQKGQVKKKWAWRDIPEWNELQK